MPSDNGYEFTPDRYPELLAREFFPEKTKHESHVYREYLSRHIHEYDRVILQVRLGVGMTPDPSHLAGVQRQAVRNSLKVIDILGWSGLQPTIIEVKIRVQIQALGQVLGYRALFREANPGALDPRLIVVGRYSDVDTLRVLGNEGIPVYLYEE